MLGIGSIGILLLTWFYLWVWLDCFFAFLGCCFVVPAFRSDFAFVGYACIAGVFCLHLFYLGVYVLLNTLCAGLFTHTESACAVSFGAEAWRIILLVHAVFLLLHRLSDCLDSCRRWFTPHGRHHFGLGPLPSGLKGCLHERHRIWFFTHAWCIGFFGCINVIVAASFFWFLLCFCRRNIVSSRL